MQSVSLLGIANITGGGLIDNLPRILPSGLSAEIDASSWTVPDIFEKMQVAGGINRNEMFRTFNMGIGMTLVMRQNHIATAQRILKSLGLVSWKIGRIISGKQQVEIS